ncbi:AtaAp protein [Cryomyces antarcticus]|uniref:1-acyl-sn-glycerol-3-phosphate acyltransferase n=1 Tax=Cryomyces antarcticus TaxID=329879 RepID=A0ABR0LS35_9PEZI|nr:1-acylglycerol-3-phosphate O-acyltransferase [Cryomyces antarcticus]KAK5020503.1 1-acylglycerol-3-phosphate O-acyltransferase [Cryomyces antarcticus]KAK5201904.1 1-acylglycerol-3-phosphate O-acyltransferase [Cryomyces antarcticus]
MALLAILTLALLTYIALMLSLYALSYLTSATTASSSSSSSTTSRISAYYARLLASWFCLILCAAYGTVASAILRVVEACGVKDAGGLSQWTVARAFKWTMWAATGVTFVVQGEEELRRRPAVFVGNHQTELDVLMLGCVFPPYTSVTAKSSLKYVPILGWFMTLSKTVFIDRKNRQTALAAFDSAVHTMHTAKQSVYIFPEGTRSYYTAPGLLPFKKGAFHLAVQAQVPIIPIVVANYSEILDSRRKVFRAGKIPVKVLPAIETMGLTAADVDRLTTETREKILDELVRLTELARGQKVALPANKAKRLDREARSSGIDVKGVQAVGAA